MNKKKILFLTGTRADFGKLKSLIQEVESSSDFCSILFVTGMHMLAKYGMTANEVVSSGFNSIYKFINQNSQDSMDNVLAKTIQGLSDFVKEEKPDLIVVHGDRVEALAGAIVGSLNNILVAHIEGGEVSGTIDELIRHSVSKLSHIHFVCNEEAKKRLIQLGEKEDSIFVIGSPDLDIMTSKTLPCLQNVKERYDIEFEEYAIFMYHPVTTDLELLPSRIQQVINALINSKDNFVVIFPNNDHGSDIIINELNRLSDNVQFRIFPSIRFESFLTLLKNAKYIVGNSSAGVREAPFYGVPTIDIGNRQNNRANAKSIFSCEESTREILEQIASCKKSLFEPTIEFGNGNSKQLFFEILSRTDFWEIAKQKVFIDL